MKFDTKKILLLFFILLFMVGVFIFSLYYFSENEIIEIENSKINSVLSKVKNYSSKVATFFVDDKIEGEFTTVKELDEDKNITDENRGDEDDRSAGSEENCESRMLNLSNAEIMDEIININNPWGVVPEYNLDRISLAQSKMFNYYVCILKRQKNEELYNEAENFISNLPNKAGTVEEDYISVLSRYDINNTSNNSPYSFTKILALADNREECGEELINTCLAFVEDTAYSDTYRDHCNNMCNYINLYKNDSEKFNDEIIEFNNRSKDEYVYDNQVIFRISMSYYFGGEKMALEFCSNIEDNRKETCLNRVKYIKNLKEYTECDELKNNIVDIICKSGQ